MKPLSDYSPTPSKATRAAQKAEFLDSETQAIIQTIREKDRRFRAAATTFFLILFAIGILGIYYQNLLAQRNQTHIDCIVKLLATHPKHGQARFIDNLATCHIKVVP